MKKTQAVRMAKAALERVAPDFGWAPEQAAVTVASLAEGCTEDHFRRASDWLAANYDRSTEKRFRDAIEATVPKPQNGGKPAATWSLDHVRERQLGCQIIRNWLTYRNEWPPLGGPEPDQPGFSFKKEALAELKRAEWLLAAGNPPDKTRQGLRLVVDRVERLRNALGAPDPEPETQRALV